MKGSYRHLVALAGDKCVYFAVEMNGRRYGRLARQTEFCFVMGVASRWATRSGAHSLAGTK